MVSGTGTLMFGPPEKRPRTDYACRLRSRAFYKAASETSEFAVKSLPRASLFALLSLLLCYFFLCYFFLCYYFLCYYFLCYYFLCYFVSFLSH